MSATFSHRLVEYLKYLTLDGSDDGIGESETNIKVQQLSPYCLLEWSAQIWKPLSE